MAKNQTNQNPGANTPPVNQASSSVGGAVNVNNNPPQTSTAPTGAGQVGSGNKPPKTEEKGDVVSLPKKTLEAILERLEASDEYIKESKEREIKRDAEIEMLKSISDKARLARFEAQQQGPLIRKARVSFWDNLPILAWTKVKDEVGFRDGRLVVDQKIRLFLDEAAEDGGLKHVDIDYLYWAQNTFSQEGEVVERSDTPQGTYWTIVLADGRKVKLDVRFINAF